jgi:hypothetical protein
MLGLHVFPDKVFKIRNHRPANSTCFQHPSALLKELEGLVAMKMFQKVRGINGSK